MLHLLKDIGYWIFAVLMAAVILSIFFGKAKQ